MKFRKKVSFYTIVLKILLGSLVRSLPQTYSSNSYIKSKKLPILLSADILPCATQSLQHEINGDIWNVFQEPVYNRFNFREIESPLVSKPKSDLVLNGKNKAPFQYKSRSKYLPKFDSLKGLKVTSNKNELTLPPEFSPEPNYRDIANFPEVEYPMSASEIWKPNYWNTERTDYSYNNINRDSYCRNPTFYEYFTGHKPMRNFGTNFKPTTQTAFSTKSYSDSTKNLILSQNKESKENLSINRNLKNNISRSLDSYTIGDHITVTPLAFTPYFTENKFKSNSSYEVCPKDSKTLGMPKNSLETDVASNLTPQSEVLVNSCADIFTHEIKSVLKTMADNIILNNLKKEELMAPAELTAHISDILESNTKCNSLNIYEEFASPDLLKNRRSQDFNEFTKYNKDFHIPIVYNDLQSKLTSTDILIDSYADKFHDVMTSILKDNADDFLLDIFENSKDHVLETNINHSGLKDYTKGELLKTQHNEHSRKDFSKFNYEPILPVIDVGINTHADKLHNEMSHMIKSTADNIHLNKFESSTTRNKPSFGTQKNTNINNNNKLASMPQSSSTGSLVNLEKGKVNTAMSDVRETVDDNNKRTEYKNNPINSDISRKKKITSTEAPSFPDVSDLKTKLDKEFCQESDNKLNNKTSTSFNDLTSSVISRNDMTCMNEESVSCKSGENIINNINNEMFLPAPDKEHTNILQDDSMNKEIELDEDFTTDSYPENDGGDWSSVALSTVAPQTSTVDITWRDVSVIEPDKSLYLDELEQYFILN